MRCAAKAAANAAARVHAAASESALASPADDSSSAAISSPAASAAAGARGSPRAEASSPPAASIAAGARGSVPRADNDDDGSHVELIYSGESDGVSDSKKTPTPPGSAGATEYEPSRKRARHTGQTHGFYQSLFSSEDEGDDSSPAPTTAVTQGSKSDDGSRHRGQDTRGTITSVGTTQEALDSNVLRLAPEQKPWQLPERLLNMWSCEATEHHPIPLFDSRQLHGLDISAKNFRTEDEFYLDAFSKHRYFSNNNKRDKSSLLQAWNAFVLNVKRIGIDAWLQKLDTLRVKFEKRSPSGVRFKLHRLSREAGIPCLSWGDPCPCCPPNTVRAQRDVYSETSAWGRAHITAEMREAIDSLQSLYTRQGRVFNDGPCEPSGGPRRTGVRDPQRQASAGNEAPSCRTTADSRASERGNSFAAPSYHGASRYAPRGSVEHRASPPVVVVEEGKPVPSRLSELELAIDRHERILGELRDDADQDYNDRRHLEATVQRIRVHRSDDQSQYAFSQLENERTHQALRDELATARREVETLRSQVENLTRDHKNLLGVLERGGCIRPSKKSRADSTDGAGRRKT